MGIENQRGVFLFFPSTNFKRNWQELFRTIILLRGEAETREISHSLTILDDKRFDHLIIHPFIHHPVFV